METKKTAGKAAGAIGMLLTGMGADGAQGLLAMKRADCLTLVQDEVSSVVWGMPGSVVKIDAQPEIVSIHKIACFPRNNSRTLFLNYNLFQWLIFKNLEAKMINTKSSTDGKELVIDIDGRFDFSVHQKFRDAYEHEKGVERFCLDMENTTYLDSAALGMLLLIRDFGGGENAAIRIINCNEDVKNILTVSSFDQLFSIS